MGEKTPIYTWICFFCGKKYPNTLLYCPKCNKARKHSYNCKKTAEAKGDQIE